MFSLPKPKSDYLIALSTPHGIMQHTMYNLPDPDHGYATDDNARALMVAHLFKRFNGKNKPILESLETAYLRFLKFAQTPEGTFYCYVTFDLQRKELGVGDWFGRSLFSLAFLYHYSTKYQDVSWDLLKMSLPVVEKEIFSPRTIAFLTLGLYYTFTKNEHQHGLNHSQTDHLIKKARQWKLYLEKRAGAYMDSAWHWPEDTITYDNGKLIQCFFFLGHLLEDEKMLRQGRDMLDFYIELTFKRGYFQSPGNRGFWKKGKKRALYDEQAVEAYSMTAALVSAYKFFGKKEYLKLAESSYMWFWGKNRLQKSLVDEVTGSVYDGLGRETLNNNQGAESYLSLCLAYFALTQKIHL